MAISFPLAFPTATGISKIVIEPNTIVGVSTSEFTGKQKVQRGIGQWWAAQIDCPPLNAANTAIWEAFLLSLNGAEGTFLMGDPRYTAPLGGAADTPGTPVVDGADQTGQTLNIKNAEPGVTGYLLAGTRLQIGTGAATRYYAVLADADSDGSGDVSVDLWPRIRTGDAPTDEASIVLTNPKGIFRLVDAVPFSARPGPFTDISFFCREAI